MRRPFEILGLILFLALAQNSQAEPCREIHGRAILYSGDSFLEIWHIGTHHTFFVVDDKSTDLILTRRSRNQKGVRKQKVGAFVKMASKVHGYWPPHMPQKIFCANCAEFKWIGTN